MKNIILISLLIILIFPMSHAFALPGDAELVLSDIGMDPPYPNSGELVLITADVYNAGLKNTNTFASIITIAYFVDDVLLDVDSIGNIEPGISNKITFSSLPLWKSSLGNHEIKVIVDYHDTLNDQYDSPTDNTVKKSFFIQPLKSSILSIDVFHLHDSDENTYDVVISLVDSKTNTPLINQKILLTLDDSDVELITNKQGLVSISNTVNSNIPVDLTAFFEGNDEYASSTTSHVFYPVDMGTSLSYDVPEWVKNTAGWWAAGQVDDDSFVSGIQFMIQEGIVDIPAPEQQPSYQNDSIPEWVKNTAGWWAAGQVDDDSFVSGIQFMIQEGILIM